MNSLVNNWNAIRALKGKREGALIIAEVAQAHDGSLGMAHAFIDAIAKTGADAVKFQTHIAAAESSPSEEWRVKFSFQDASRYDYWKRMEFTEEQWAGLRRHADEKGVKFLSSPFSVEAVELLTRVGVAAWKIASGEVNNAPMFDRMAATKLPLFISTGMSRLDEIDAAVLRAQARDLPVAVLQCTSAYPCPAEKVGLNMISFFRDRYGCAVGLSDHSGTIYPGLAAAALGIDILEVHVTFDRDIFGPDVTSSVTFAELRELVEGARFIARALSHPIDKDLIADELTPLRKLFMKSIVVRSDLPAGSRLRAEDLALKKPGDGLPASLLPSMIGRTLRCPVAAHQLLMESDLVPEMSAVTSDMDV